MLGSFWNWLASNRLRKPAATRERSARPRRRVPLYIESLENRELLANVNWINPAGGDWNTASNWSTGVVPGAADNVTIAQASNSTITLSTSSTVQNFILAGGTLAGAGNLTVNGTTNFTGGAMTGTGHTIAMNGLTITGFVSLDGRTLENRALAKLLNDSAGINPTISLRNGAAILNAATGTWDFQVDSFVNADDNTATSFTNLGTITKTGTIGTVDMLTAFTNSGSVSVSAGTFDLKGGGTSTGGFILAGGTTLAIDAGSFTFQTGTTFAGVLGSIGGIRIAGGTANFSTGTPITVSSLVESSGTLTGSDTITVTGTTNWFGGTMSGAGTTIAGASSAISSATWLAGTATFTTSAAHPFVVGQTVAISGMTPTAYNGTFTIVSVPNTTTFTVAIAANLGAATAFGIATSGSLTLGTNLTLARTLQYAGATPWTMPTANLFTLPTTGTFTYPGAIGGTSPGLTATMTVTVADDINGNGLADPGDTLQYTVTVTNNGATTAENLAFTDALDPNTTLLSESVTYPPSITSTVITDANLANIVAAAITRWQAAGISSAQLAMLKQLKFSIADLEGLNVTQSVGNNIAIDQTAANQGWFVDATPLDDAEFATTVTSTHLAVATLNAASGRLDLLTAVMRQMGAILGITAADSPDLMGGVLKTGTRDLPAATSLLSSWKASGGFHFAGSYFQNLFGQNEKWFQDRNQNYYGILPNGNLIRYDGVSFASSAATPVTNLGVAVYDDPTLLFNAQVTIAPAVSAQLSALRTTFGFYFTGNYQQNVLGQNEKWFFDRNNNYFGLLPNGDLIQYDGVSIATSKAHPIANLGVAVYDDPTLLFNAPVTLAPAITTLMSSLRVASGFHSVGNIQNVFGQNEKFFQDRNNNYYALLPNGDLVRYDGVSLQSSKTNPANVVHLDPLVFDDPTLLFNAPVTIPTATLDRIAAFRTSSGFHSIGAVQNVFGENEKWFQDRNQNYYALLPNGDLVRYDGVSLKTSEAHPVANLGVLVYDDPTILFNAPITQSAAAAAQLEFYRTTFGFYFIGDYSQNVLGQNEKWFHDRNDNWYSLLPNGDLIKWDGISIATSKAHPIANLGVVVYDDPTLLFNADVTFSSTTISELVALRSTYGFYSAGDYFKNLMGSNEKWFQDRTGSYYSLLPNGDLIKWNGISIASSKLNPIANVGPLVYDNPTLLFTAQAQTATDLPPLGSLGVGQSSVITFQAQINNVLTPAQTTAISNQGTITGLDSATQTPYTPVLTDDPALPGAADPTKIAVIPVSVFDDADLEAAVDSALGLPAGHIVTKPELLTLTSLTVDSNVITSLKGLEFATNLQSLSLLPNDWSVTTPLVSLAPIAGLTSLKSLALVRSGITNAQLATLGGLTNLKSLDLRYNAITSLTAISNFHALASLQIYGNAITDFSPLAGKVINLDLPPVNADKAQNVTQLAAALYKSPIEILQYVTNNVANQFYTGSLKGPQATLETLAGNDWDQANLLKSLLDASGVFATRYVSGTIEVPTTTLLSLFGVNNSFAVGQLLATLGLHSTIQRSGTSTEAYQFDHTWVEMETSASGPWIDLDPTWKFSDAQPGIANIVTSVPFDDNAYLITQSSAGQNALTPIDYYTNQISAYLATNQPGSSLADVAKAGSIHQQTLATLPSNSPYLIIGTPTFSSTVPASQKSTIQITLTGGINQTLNVPDVSLSRITIEYTSAGGGLLTPKLMVDGTVMATGSNIASGSAVTLTLVQREPGGTQTFTYSRTAGQFLAIGVNALQVSDRLLDRERDAINAAAAAALDGATPDPDQQIGAVLALGLFQWFDETGKAEATINGLTGAVSVYAGNLTSGVATSDSTVDFNANLQIPYVPRNVSLEMQDYFHLSLDLSADNTFNNTRGHIIGFNGSELEGAVWEELLNVPSMSAIKSLELANSLLIPTFTINSGNAATLMPQLTLDSATKALIQTELTAGATVIVPRDPTPFNGFNGVGFISKKTNGQEKYIVTRANSGIAILGSVATSAPVAAAPVSYNSDATQTLIDGTVNVASGNVVRTETDFNLPGVGLPLTFTRTYNSLSTIDHGMGAGWSFSFGDFLTFNGDGSIGWTTDTGILHTFASNGAGGFIAPNTIHGTLTASGSGYTYRDPNGLVHQFDLLGKLTAIIDRNGNALNITYAGSQITTVTESGAVSRSLTFTYTAGHITSISDGTGRAWTYAYTGNALTQATAPTSAATQYAYFTDTALGGLLRQVTAPDGSVSTFAYYGNRRVYQVIDPTGDMQIFSDNLYRNQASYTDQRGNTTVYTYNSVGNVTAIAYADGTRESSVWSNNLKQSATDVFGQTESYTYDANGNLTQTTDRLGNVTTRTYESTFNQIAMLTQPGGRITTYAYDANGNLTSITDAMNGVTTMTYYANGLLKTKTTPRGSATGTVGDYTTTYTYNDGGQILTQSTDLPSTDSYTYDTRGRMLTHTDANNNTTTYAYDLLDRLISTTDPLGKVTSNTYDAVGNRISTTDALGRVTLFVYDAEGRLVKTTFADGTYTTAQYDAAGNLVSSTDELGRTSVSVYDNRNRVIQAIKPDGTSTLTRYDGDVRVAATTDAKGNVTKSTYDKDGRLLTTIDALNGVTTRTYDGVGNLLTIRDPLAHTTTYQYDLLNRQTRMTDALGNITNYTYDADGNLITIAAPLGQTTLSTYDVLGRLTATTNALGNTVTRTYDAVGNLKTLSGPSNNITTYSYDALNRLISQTNPAGGATETFAYDFVGNQTSVTDFNGRTTRYTYDLRNRQVKEEWLSAGTPIYTINYSYDAAGQLTSASDPSSTYHYTYNKVGLVLTADNYGSPGVTRVQTQYTYDAVGNVLTVRDLYGNVLHDDTATAYDALNRATRINNSTLSYNAASQLTTLSNYANSTLTALVASGSYTYDANGNITGLTYATPNGMAQYSWTYNAAGRIATRVTAGVTSTYTYDANGQLLTATQPSESYTYDANGNRAGGAMVYGSGNRLLSDGSFTYNYDASGNLISQTQLSNGAVTEYTWDYRNRLTSVTFKSGGVVQKTETFTYDMFDRRIAKTVDPDGPGILAATTERYVYNGAQIALQFDGAGALMHQFAYGPTGQVLTDTNAAGAVVWALADNLGSVRFLLNSASAIVDQIAYNSYGAVVTETNPAANFLFGFDGLAIDRDSGLQFDGTNYYNPRIGRYVRENALSFGIGDANLYRFNGNNPLE